MPILDPVLEVPELEDGELVLVGTALAFDKTCAELDSVCAGFLEDAELAVEVVAVDEAEDEEENAELATGMGLWPCTRSTAEYGNGWSDVVLLLQHSLAPFSSPEQHQTLSAQRLTDVLFTNSPAELISGYLARARGSLTSVAER